MDLHDDTTIKEFLQNRQLKPSTAVRYIRAITLYSNFINKAPIEFIKEAENQEDDRIRMRNRKIKEYLLDFRDHLLHEDYSPKTISVILTIIKSFYAEFDIELPRTQLKQKQTQEGIKDIPSKKDIRFALKHTDLKYKAVITLMLSSGMGASEISSLTYQHFYNSIKNYVEIDVKEPLNVEEIEEILSKNDTLIVAEWNLIRIKTGLNYTTFSSPESVYSIFEYLRKYPPNKLSDPLFKSQVTRDKLTPETIFKYFHRLNLNCKFGMPNRQSFLRSHSLRKYFATTLYKKGIPQLSIDFLLAHKIDAVTSAYFKADIESLKNQYITCIEELSIEDYEVHVLETSEYKEIKSLRKELNEMKVLMDKEREDKINKLPLPK